jgi:tetratricopeptide (TPR) repeat protein
MTWVFWVHAGTRARFEEGYRRIAEATRMDGWDNHKVDILRLVRSWLCDESNGRWVVIVDNADDSSIFYNRPQHDGADSLDQSVEPLSDFLPQSPNGSILFTSRSRDVARRLTGSDACLLVVQPMDENQALALLHTKFSFDADKHDAIELLQALDCMPLAITQAAAYIEQRAPRMTISRYIDEIRKTDHDRARLLTKDVGDDRRDGRASNSIMATWHISFEHIRRNIPTAARLLSLMCLFDRQGIPESLLQTQYQRDKNKGADFEEGEDDFEEDIHTLTSYFLIGMNAAGDEFEMHRLVQYSTKKWLELHNELETWKETYVRLLDGSYPGGQYENWTICQKLFPHAQSAIECRPANTKGVQTWASVLYKAAWYASETGKYKEAEEMNRAAFEARESSLGASHPDTLESVNGLALVLNRQGKYEQAEAINRRVLEGRKSALGAKHPDTITSLNNLAAVLKGQGKYEQAEDLDRQALEGREKILGKDHPDTLQSLDNLAFVLQRQGKYKQAEEMNQRALRGYEKALGKDHPDTLVSVGNLALVLQLRGKYNQAEVMNQRALKGREKVLGKDHPDTLTNLNNLAAVLQGQGKYEQAEDLDRRALEGREKILGKDHPHTLQSLNNLARVLQRQGKYEQADEMNQRVLVGREKVLGKDHPNTLASVYYLAQSLHRRQQYKDALPLYQRACAGYQDKLGLDHPSTQACLEGYSSLQQLLTSERNASIAVTEDRTYPLSTSPDIAQSSVPGSTSRGSDVIF